MKRWYIISGEMVFTCSLLNMEGKAKIMSVKSDCGHTIHFQFMKFYDFSKAKEGVKQTGWCKLPDTNIKVRARAFFK